MSGIIIYKSKYGSSKKYAEWLSEKTGYKYIEISKVKTDNLKNYDTIILGSGIYMSKLSINKFVENNFDFLKIKNTFVFGVGLCPYEDANIQTIKNNSFNHISFNLPFVYCRGSINIDSMKFLDKILCKMLKKAVLNKPASDRNLLESTIAETKEGDNDWTDKNFLNPILESLDLI